MRRYVLFCLLGALISSIAYGSIFYHPIQRKPTQDDIIEMSQALSDALDQIDVLRRNIEELYKTIGRNSFPYDSMSSKIDNLESRVSNLENRVR